MKVALVHDYLNQYGGAERVLQALSEIFPEAPIYTLIYDKKRTGYVFSNKKIYTSFLQKIPFAKSYHRAFLLLMPLGIEQFDLSSYDLVISDSASYAKGIITLPSTVHICYCHTPIRYAWDDSYRYIKEFGYPSFFKKIIPFFLNYIRIWDVQASKRVDYFIANSKFVKRRIKKYYRRKAEVIYPPVETKKFFISNSNKDYFLMVGRFLPYKRFDLAISVFNKLKLPLKIVGDGPEKSKLKKLALPNIEFLGLVSDEKLAKLYSNCKALIFPQEEDFGIVALEAMASGRPVIAYKGGGVLETVKEKETGIFFEEQTEESLMEAIRNFKESDFNPELIRNHSLKFDKEIFKQKIKEFIESKLK